MRSTSTNNLLGLQTINGKKLQIPEPFETGKPILFQFNGRSASVFSLKFEDFKKASQYAMERRLFLLRKFETFIEPYFGTSSADECQSNLEASLLEVDENTLISVLNILTYGQDRVIKDCLVKNNTDWVRIELLVCGNTFYDIRTYYPISDSKPEYKQTAYCKK
jgi:hypothetical protein